LLTDSYPEIDERFTIIPHGRDFPRFARIGTPPKPTERLRVLVPGNIGPHKGAHILKEIAALGRSQRVELHFLGKCHSTLRGVRVQHGPYNREDFVEKVEAIRPHVGIILSIWHETYIHTLTEMWAGGLPVVAVDIGAAGERIRMHGGGWLVQKATAERVLETLQRLRSDPEDYRRKIKEVVRWQEGEGLHYGTAEMASRYVALYEGVKTARSCNATSCVPSGHSITEGREENGIPEILG
jgi:glycosyltransferase involved in cell wall biosynthesis